MFNLAIQATRQGAAAQIFSGSPETATQAAALFLLSGVESVFDKTLPAPTPVEPSTPGEVTPPATPAQSAGRASAMRAVAQCSAPIVASWSPNASLTDAAPTLAAGADVQAAVTYAATTQTSAAAPSVNGATTAPAPPDGNGVYAYGASSLWANTYNVSSHGVVLFKPQLV